MNIKLLSWLLLALLLLLASCASLGLPPASTPPRVAGADPLLSFKTQPLEKTALRLAPLTSLDELYRVLGQPLKVAKADAPNKFDKTVIDTTYWLDYGSYQIAYYFVKQKAVFFPTQIAFGSNAALNKDFRVIGLARKTLDPLLRNRQVLVSNTHQIVLVFDDQEQVSIFLGDDQKVERVTLGFYLD